MRFFLGFVLALMLILPAYAQEEEAQPVQEEKVEMPAVSFSEEEYERKLALAEEMHQIWPVRIKVEKALDRAALSLPPEERAVFKASMRKAIKFRLLEEDSINAMMKVFSVDELQAMVDFYGSSTGRAISAKTDMYQQEISPTFTRMMDKALMDIKTGAAPGDVR